MMQHAKIWLIIASSWLFIGNVNALDGISISNGIGVANLKIWRVSVEQTWQKKWTTKGPWYVTGYWDLSFYKMKRKNGEEIAMNNNIAAVALAPVFRFYRIAPTLSNKNFYVEFAIGIAQMNKREIAKRQLGINFQFEDRLGFGLRFGNKQQYDISYRVVHFSNAYLGKKNHGINLQMLTFNYWFG